MLEPWSGFVPMSPWSHTPRSNQLSKLTTPPIGHGLVCSSINVRTMWLSGISSHGAGGLISPWGNTIMSPWVHIVPSWYLLWYDLSCYQDVKLQQPTICLHFNNVCIREISRLTLLSTWQLGIYNVCIREISLLTLLSTWQLGIYNVCIRDISLHTFNSFDASVFTMRSPDSHFYLLGTSGLSVDQVTCAKWKLDASVVYTQWSLWSSKSTPKLTWQDGMVEWAERPSKTSHIQTSWVQTLVESKRWLKKLYLALSSHALSIIKDWFNQCQDNMTERDIRSWFWWPCLPVAQHYKVVMSMHSYESVRILIWP